MKHVVIIGGGIIGLSTAFALHQKGMPEITILDSAPGPHGASIVNAGEIVPAHAGPVPAPGLVGQSIKWMLRSDSPLYIKPRLTDLEFTHWLFRFWRACNERNYVHAVDSMAALNRETFPLFDRYKEVGVRFQMESVGLLCAFLSARNLENELKHWARYFAFGLPVPTPIWGKEARDLEPALADGVNGVFHLKSERHLRPDTLTTGLIEWLGERGVAYQPNTRVVGLEVRNSRVDSVQATGGNYPADAVVIAAGAHSGQIAKMAGVKLPIQGGKGYSIDYDNPPTKVSHPISLFEVRVAVTPMGAWTRLAGTMELSGINTIVRKERVAALARGASQFIRNWPSDVGAGRVDSGLRPMTPDGMPVIGMLPGYTNLVVSTGHQMLGLTLAPASADLLADLLVTGKANPILEPFTAGRFG